MTGSLQCAFSGTTRFRRAAAFPQTPRFFHLCSNVSTVFDLSHEPVIIGVDQNIQSREQLFIFSFGIS